MSELIHMSPEEVSGLLAEIESLLRRWDDDLSLLHTLGSAIHQIWEAPATVDYIYDVHRILHAMEGEVERLQYNHRLARHEFEEWLAADALLGDGVGVSVGAVVGGAGASEGPSPPWVERICKGKGDECEDIWSKPPQNAYHLAYMIDTLPEDQPIGIFPLGNGEVLVLLKGTDPDSPERGHNWGSAIESFFTHKSSYQLSVLAALQAAKAQGLIPEGAKLHIAGHSQGGMVAQNLSSDPRLRKLGMEVETVVTFGSPDTFAKANPSTQYVMFENESDIVPHIDEYFETAVVGEAATSPGLVEKAGAIFTHHRLNDVEHLAKRYVLHAPASDVLEAHQYTRQAVQAELETMQAELEKKGETLLPAKFSSAWGGEGVLYQSKIQTPLAATYYGGAKIVISFMRRVFSRGT